MTNDSLQVKDKRTYIFDVGDLVIGIYAEDDSETEPAYTTPQRIRKKEDIEELIPGKRPYKMLYQIIWFEGNRSMYLGELFKPFDEQTKVLVKDRNEKANLQYSEKRLIKEKKQRTSSKRQTTLAPMLNTRIFKTTNDIEFYIKSLLLKTSTGTIKFDEIYKGVLTEIRRTFNLASIRAVKIVFTDNSYHKSSSSEHEVVDYLYLKTKDATNKDCYVLYKYLEPNATGEFVTVGLETIKNPTAHNSTVSELTIADVDSILNVLIEQNLFKPT